MDFDVNKLGVDSITINGSKLYGVKGVSALYLKGGKGVATQICGGGQESYIRGGTENLPAIVALAEATSITLADRASNNSKISLLKEKLIDSLKKEIPSVRINTPVNSISNIVHVTFLNQQKIDIINELDKRGICASNGAACSSNKDMKSRVLQSIGFSESEIDMSVRFSLGKRNTAGDIKKIIKALKDIFKK